MRRHIYDYYECYEKEWTKEVKIILCGAHSTGKTTVANLLSEEMRLSRRESVSRKSPYQPGTPENQRYIMSKVYEENVSTLYNGYVLERSVFDVDAYTKLYDLRMLYSYDAMKMDTAARIFKANDDYILFYFPITFGLVADGVRPEDEAEQKEVDLFLKYNLDSRKVKYHTVPTGSPETRVRYIKRKMKKHATV